MNPDVSALTERHTHSTGIKLPTLHMNLIHDTDAQFFCFYIYVEYIFVCILQFSFSAVFFWGDKAPR